MIKLKLRSWKDNPRPLKMVVKAEEVIIFRQSDGTVYITIKEPDDFSHEWKA